MNYNAREDRTPCIECLLTEFVPLERRFEKIPCRYIPLDAAGQTLETLYAEALEEPYERYLNRYAQIREPPTDCGENLIFSECTPGYLGGHFVTPRGFFGSGNSITDLQSVAAKCLVNRLTGHVDSLIGSCPVSAAGSTGRRNTCAKFTRRSLKAQSFSWTLI